MHGIALQVTKLSVMGTCGRVERSRGGNSAERQSQHKCTSQNIMTKYLFTLFFSPQNYNFILKISDCFPPIVALTVVRRKLSTVSLKCDVSVIEMYVNMIVLKLLKIWKTYYSFNILICTPMYLDYDGD